MVEPRHSVQESFQCLAVPAFQGVIQCRDSLFNQFHRFVSFHCCFLLCMIAAGIWIVHLQVDLPVASPKRTTATQGGALAPPSSSERRRRERTLTPWYDERLPASGQSLSIPR